MTPRAHAVALIEPDSLLRLSEYDRNYLLIGTPLQKIQMSVKEQPLQDFGLFATYTQMMFWQSVKNRGPFREVNFNPSVFYRWHRLPESWLNALDFGFDHKSNGQGGSPRRSYNDGFIELHADHELAGGSLLSTTRFYAVFGLDEENRDLRNYFGFWQSSLSYIRRETKYFKLVELYLTVHPGGRFGYELSRGSEELGLRLKIGASRSIPYLYLQFFNGYGEGLATYNERTSSFRIGFQL